MTNILNEKLEICSKDPLTGFTRTGYCDDTTLDSGKHNVCVETDKEFLDYTKSKGNDLYSVVSPGDKWCVCEDRYLQAFNDNKAPKVIKNATNNKTKNKIKDIIKMQKAGSKTRKNNRILPKLKKVDSTGKKHKYRLKFTAKKRRLAINEGIMDKSKKMTTRKAATAKKGRLNILRIYRRNKNLKDCNKITSDMRYIDKKYKLGKTKNICGQKGGDPVSPSYGNFVEFENIKNDICVVCQSPLKDPEIIAENGIVYQLSCGHQFHNNCLNQLCVRKVEKADSEHNGEEKRSPYNFKCPICNQETLREEEDCVSTETLYPIKPSSEYASEKYTGKKPENKGFFGFFTGGKTRNKTKKNKKTTRKRRKKQKKQFLYNPNDPSKSFDVYIDKNPNDTIPIKYTTVKDVKDTINKLERLYKTKKYPHKRIWQVGMIMKVRLEAMKKHKKTRYPNAKGVTSRFNLANKYFKFLGKRSKKHSFDERKNMVFKF